MVATGEYDLSETDSQLVDQHPVAFTIGLSIGFAIYIGIGIADCLLAAKQIKYGITIRRQSNMASKFKPTFNILVKKLILIVKSCFISYTYRFLKFHRRIVLIPGQVPNTSN